MPTELVNYVTPHPGLEQMRRVTTKLHVAEAEGAVGRLAANHLSQTIEKIAVVVGNQVGYPSENFTETKDSSSTIAVGATGFLLTTADPSVDNDDTQIRSVRTFALAAGKVYNALCKIKVSSAANVGIYFGFATSAMAEVFTTAPADGVYLAKLENAATMVGRVIENSHSAADSGTLKTFADDTFVELGIRFEAGSSAETSRGSFFIDGVETPFTSAQRTDLFEMLTGPPTLACYLGVRANGTAAQRTTTVQYAFWEVDL